MVKYVYYYLNIYYYGCEVIQVFVKLCSKFHW